MTYPYDKHILEDLWTCSNRIQCGLKQFDLKWLLDFYWHAINDKSAIQDSSERGFRGGWVKCKRGGKRGTRFKIRIYGLYTLLIRTMQPSELCHWTVVIGACYHFFCGWGIRFLISSSCVYQCVCLVTFRSSKHILAYLYRYFIIIIPLRVLQGILRLAFKLILH